MNAKSMTQNRAGFTLIELLIVVAIIAILAAIAVPNFLEAQIRSKVSRTKADMRTVATALEAYYVDYNGYVLGNDFGVGGAKGAGFPTVLERLSTPVAYVTTGMMPDPFQSRFRSNSAINGMGTLTSAQISFSNWAPVPGNDPPHLYKTYLYISTAPAQAGYASNASGIMRVENDNPVVKADGYIMNSASPMGAYINAGGVVANSNKDYAINLVYDPTNGTISFGNVWRAGGSPGRQDNIYGAIATQR